METETYSTDGLPVGDTPEDGAAVPAEESNQPGDAPAAAPDPHAAPDPVPDPADPAADEDAREMERLMREWPTGEAWRENLAHGRDFVDRFGDDAARAVLDEHGLGDHAAVIRLAARAGRHIADLERELAELKGEAPLRQPPGRGPAPLSDARRRELEDEHRRLRTGDDYWSGGHARARAREIMETLHGTMPIAVHAARGDAGRR